MIKELLFGETYINGYGDVFKIDVTASDGRSLWAKCLSIAGVSRTREGISYRFLHNGRVPYQMDSKYNLVNRVRIKVRGSYGSAESRFEIIPDDQEEVKKELEIEVNKYYVNGADTVFKIYKHKGSLYGKVLITPPQSFLPKDNFYLFCSNGVMYYTGPELHNKMQLVREVFNVNEETGTYDFSPGGFRRNIPIKQEDVTVIPITIKIDKPIVSPRRDMDGWDLDRFRLAIVAMKGE